VTAELARVGGPLGCAGLALLMVATRRDLRIAGLALWALGGVFLAAYLAPSGHHTVLAAGAVLVLVAAVVGAFLLERWPWLLAVGVLACVPARIQVKIGSEKASLLIPLYGIVLAAALALAYRLFRGDERNRELGPLAWPLAAFVAWSGLSLAWTSDLRQGSIELLFFFLPFGLLVIALARLPWNRRWILALYGLLSLMAVSFAVIGVYQWATREVFWNPKVIVANAYAPSSFFYRVNSVFYDPSIYGRFLVVAILASLVILLYTRSPRPALFLAALIATIWTGLLFSFSQSSFVALVAAVLVAAAFAWRRRAVSALGLVGAVLVLAGFSAPQVRYDLLAKSGTGVNRVTSDRFGLVKNGIKLAADHPIQGVGIGGFKHSYARKFHLPGKEPKKAASHDTPVTVAAETGIPGLALLGWLFVAAILGAWRRVPSSFEGRTALFAGLALGAIAVHSLFYNAFFEDPMMWGLLGLIVIVSAAVRKQSEEKA
jgi:O-antigen ligase